MGLIKGRHKLNPRPWGMNARAAAMDGLHRGEGPAFAGRIAPCPPSQTPCCHLPRIQSGIPNPYFSQGNDQISDKGLLGRPRQRAGRHSHGEARTRSSISVRLNRTVYPSRGSDPPQAETGTTFKGPWPAERTCRGERSTREVQSFLHHRNSTSVGHLMISFLALRQEVDPRQSPDEQAADTPWPDLRCDISQVLAIGTEPDGQRYRLHIDPCGVTH